MLLSRIGIAFAGAVIVASALVSAQPAEAKQGCGPGWWRGPYGHCRHTPFYGRLPDGEWKVRRTAYNGCPPGYWRGPWGHCRDTPYHGRLPGGGWK
jgi:hypothetical protein